MQSFTEEQKSRFADYIADSHSWHKHLSLLNGGQFIITLDENSGSGYPTMHPKLPFGNTMAGYQEAFGKLVFFWKTYDEVYFQTDGPISNLTFEEIRLKYPVFKQLTLFPYISADFCEAINFHRGDFEKLTTTHHQQKDLLRSVYESQARLDFLWQHVLTENERESISDEKAFTSENSETYLTIESKMAEHVQQLRQFELDKIKNTLDEI